MKRLSRPSSPATASQFRRTMGLRTLASVAVQSRKPPVSASSAHSSVCKARARAKLLRVADREAYIEPFIRRLEAARAASKKAALRQLRCLFVGWVWGRSSFQLKFAHPFIWLLRSTRGKTQLRRQLRLLLQFFNVYFQSTFVLRASPRPTSSRPTATAA